MVRSNLISGISFSIDTRHESTHSRDSLSPRLAGHVEDIGNYSCTYSTLCQCYYEVYGPQPQAQIGIESDDIGEGDIVEESDVDDDKLVDEAEEEKDADLDEDGEPPETVEVEVVMHDFTEASDGSLCRFHSCITGFLKIMLDFI